MWPWPAIPPAVPATSGIGPPGHADLPVGASRPPPNGLLDLTLPWATFTGAADRPGVLGRIGPITAPQARQAVSLALRDLRTQWRVVLVDPDGRALAVARVPRARLAASRHDPTAIAASTAPATASPGATAGTGTGTPATAAAAVTTTPIVGRVTLVMPADAAGAATAPHASDSIYARILAAARSARDHAQRQADADQHAPGGCAHATASPAYQPPPRIRDYVTARDQTCRHPRCGQPAWRADLDHTTPYDQGGPTCSCNLGALCRRHHQLKQHSGWTLTQPRSGTFAWATPAGRSYAATPDPYLT